MTYLETLIQLFVAGSFVVCFALGFLAGQQQ